MSLIFELLFRRKRSQILLEKVDVVVQQIRKISPQSLTGGGAYRRLSDADDGETAEDETTPSEDALTEDSISSAETVPAEIFPSDGSWVRRRSVDLRRCEAEGDSCRVEKEDDEGAGHVKIV